MLPMRRAALLLALCWCAPALAHAGAHEAEAGPPGWTTDPLVTLPLAIAAVLYAVGWARLRARAEGGRRMLGKQAALFAVGWLVLAGAVVSPLHEAGERSFTMHMIGHELIMLVAALLLVVARPGPAMLWGLPASARGWFGRVAHVGPMRALWRFLTDPVVATVVQAIAMWAWHAPALFDRALGHEGWHVAQHLSFLATALLFWWAMANGRRGRGVSALCLFATSLVGGLLGALMAFSASPWYAGYAAMGMTPFGLSPTEDQHLAGLLMWVPGGLVHAGAALFFLHRMLSEGRDVLPARRAARAAPPPS